MKGTFRSLHNYNYRLWAIGALISNIGTWMQRTAQDWLVLTQLTNESATAVGIVMSLQFGPALLLLPLTGYVADHCDRRKILMVTQLAMGVLALGLGLLTLSGHAQLWHVYVFALLLGCVSAFDATARQTFVSELVGENDLANAVALNSTSFNVARMVGPAVAGLLIASIGTGWVFLVNGLSYVAVICSLWWLHQEQLHRHDRTLHAHGGLLAGFRYVWNRPDLKVLLFMLFLLGTFGLNFPIFISTMAVTVFHVGAREYGILTSAMAIGSVMGALLAAAQAKPGIARIVVAASVFGIGCGVAALMPSYGLFGAVLVVIGISAQTYTTSTNSVVQLSTDPGMRGRVMAILLGILLGATPLGAPLVGWVADNFGPRWALGVGALSGIAAAIAGLRHVRNSRT
jgi:MFS family permease